jgi:hypothetical protein
MLHTLLTRLVLAPALAFPLLAFADRPAEDRARATHVVIGRVVGLFTLEGAAGANQDCLVEIAVEKVERGADLKAGMTVYASVYRPNPRAPDLKKMSEREQKRYLLTVDGGHAPTPKAGSRVRVFLIHRGGKYTGIFPDWVDTLKGE